MRRNSAWKLLCAADLGVLALAATGTTAQASTYTWAQGTAGTYNWSNTANWTSTGYPDGTADVADFLSSPGFLDTPTNSITVNVDTPITLAELYSARAAGNTISSTGTVTYTGDDFTFVGASTITTANIETLYGPAPIFDNNIDTTGPGALNIVPYSAMTVNGAITSSSGVNLETGNLTLGSDSNNINEVSLSYHSVAALIAANNGAFSGIGTIAFDPTNGGELEANVSGTTTVSASLNLSNSAGTITLDSYGASSILDFTTNSITNTGGAGAISIYRVNSTAAIVEFSGAGFNVAKPVVLTVANLELAPASGTQTWSGNFTAPNSYSQNLTIGGNGAVILSGNNSYYTQTDVQGSSLLIDGTQITSIPAGTTTPGVGSATTGNFQVESGATLGGAGRIEIGVTSTQTAYNAILVKSGGFIAPGSNGVGALTLDAGDFTTSGAGTHTYLNMASGSAFNFDLDGSGGTPDQINLWNYLNGDLSLNANALNLDLAGVQAPGTYTVPLFNFYGDSGDTPTASDISSGLTLGTLGPGIESANIIYDTDSIDLQYTVAAPEPTALALLGLGGLVLLSRRRRIA